MESTGNKSWSGMDVALYQELCGSRPKQRVPQTREKREENKRKRPSSGCPGHTMKVDATSRGASSLMFVRCVERITQSASVELGHGKPSTARPRPRQCVK